jgi:hypothetical protein
MPIYLACTVRGARSGVLAGRAICHRLQQLGHEVLTTHLLTEDVDCAEAKLTEEQVYTSRSRLALALNISSARSLLSW